MSIDNNELSQGATSSHLEGLALSIAAIGIKYIEMIGQPSEVTPQDSGTTCPEAGFQFHVVPRDLGLNKIIADQWKKTFN